MDVTQYKWQEGVPRAEIVNSNEDALKLLFKQQPSKSCNREKWGFLYDR